MPIFKITGCLMLQKLWKNERIPQGWEICEKDDIFTVQEKRVALIGKIEIISLEMTPQKIEIEERWLNKSKMRIKKQIREEK